MRQKSEDERYLNSVMSKRRLTAWRPIFTISSACHNQVNRVPTVTVNVPLTESQHCQPKRGQESKTGQECVQKGGGQSLRRAQGVTGLLTSALHDDCLAHQSLPSTVDVLLPVQLAMCLWKQVRLPSKRTSNNICVLALPSLLRRTL